eukprot:NODE_2665_length_1124_cov_3.456369_g2543_i0.p1 GENE.NODE_2665_length_1124_cov_3.456369_g2543_i0~~NODE_2665_length_1124_cov_3.456369_g2543_i0.p1  ORF type:complete len:253 (+),score=60.50 NODE_2665_length_1124_cov_3.456369_g2543_i0:304-1062(+)
MQRRRVDRRPTWNFTQTEPVSGNYYPVNTALHIADATAQLTLLADASQGGTGLLGTGQLEMMVHRRLLQDDGRGMGEPLDEREHTTPYVDCTSQPCGQATGPGLIVRGTHYLTLNSPATAAKHWRPLQDQVYAPPQMLFANTPLPTTRHSFLTAALPPNVQLMTLEKLAANQILLRLSHQFAIHEDSAMSTPVTLNLQSLFPAIPVRKAEETSLTANQLKSDMQRLSWEGRGEKAAPARGTLSGQWKSRPGC